jgi:tetrahydromethanopterin S-methyltransferase subunit F
MATSTVQSNLENNRAAANKKAAKTRNKMKARAVTGKTRAKTAESLSAQLYRQGRDAVSGAYDSAAKAGAKASRAMPDLRYNLDLRSRSQSLYSTMEAHPIVIGAVGLGVGMVLAALLPSTGKLRSRR